MVTGKVLLQSYGTCVCVCVCVWAACLQSGMQEDLWGQHGHMETKNACRSVITLSKKMGLRSFFSMTFSTLFNL
jgi:hypothetical protein